MRNPFARAPWFAFTPLFLGAVLAAALVANYLGADYFKRTFVEEPNPLLAAGASTPPVPAPNAGSPVPTRDGASATPMPGTGEAAARPLVVAMGMFRDGEPGHRGSGTATLGRDAAGRAVLVLSDFSVTNGPDLHVILGATPGGGGDGLDLGKLKATDGTFSYDIPADADLASFRSVTIWCASFPTIFAVATLGG